ncbi:MAG: hypothetical protein AAF291_10670 [Pseudomonadota bacterium]
MILASALLALAAQATATPATDPEIVVLGRLRTLQANVGQGPNGNWYCSLNGSTGRAWLDDKFCRAVTKCVRKGASDDAAVSQCIRSSRKKLVKRVEKEMKKGS